MRSVLSQRLSFDVELVISNDASTDNSHKVISSITSPNSRVSIRYFNHSKNKGMIPNFIWTLNKCTGDFIALCEGDDYWDDPNKLQNQVDLLVSDPKIALVFTNGWTRYENSEIQDHAIYELNSSVNSKYHSFKLPRKLTSYKDLLKGNYIHTAGVLFRNWIRIEGIPDYLYRTSIGDWPLHLKTAQKGDIYFMDDMTFTYRIHERGMYSSKSELRRCKMAVGQISPMLESCELGPNIIFDLQEYTVNNMRRYLLLNNGEEDQYFQEMKSSLLEYYPNLDILMYPKQAKTHLGIARVMFRLKRSIKKLIHKD